MNVNPTLSAACRRAVATALATATTLCVTTTMAADGQYALTIQDHRFQPAELVIPAGTKIRLAVENRDATPEEFESHDLNREKIVTGGSTATIYVGPLAPGRYRFFGEYNEKTAQGVIVAQ